MNSISRALLAGLFAIVGVLGSLTFMLESANGASLDGSEQDLVARINAFRAARSLPTLAVSDTLTSAAKWMSLDMGARNYFAHTSLDGRSPTQRMADAGYPAFGTWTGEDLAAGYTSTGDVLNGWINSPAHYAVLVNPHYHAIGVGRGYATGSTYGWYWTADFGGVVDLARVAPAPRAATATAARVVLPAVPAQTALPPDSGYHASWNAQSADPTVDLGGTATLVVALTNTGSRGWYREAADRKILLGTNDPRDAEYPELAAGWASLNRVSSTTTDYVGPGEVGWFEFTVRAPETPGDYRLALRGVVEGVAWLEDDGIFFTIHVSPVLATRGGVSFAP
ncbi:MAG TPA: CAP domain-containing protein [Candidatus Limnocylindria bacterium]|nr:CAP domain-containing protein [Candidatus Limnocylindria bacterium]